MHQEIELTKKHEVFINLEDDMDKIAYGQVSFTQILLLEIHGYIRQKDGIYWQVLAEQSETEH
jgi:hypothetical protein